MCAADVGDIQALAGLAHPDLFERPEIFAERLALYPRGCATLVERATGRIEGYVVSHPWTAIAPPKLDCLLEKLPDRPNAYYIHDLVLSSGVRGTGLARMAVALCLDQANHERLDRVCLISVGCSGSFWRAMGFQMFPDWTGAISDYGPAALAMTVMISQI